ncbi:hypothetical protein IGI04_019904 [Brassica rapa subsp. trilocularis]|uniref:Uncharacterized protein n=1 Tax=Brassica rapa subsp. trilocularis TaxID=1813537 RepID=A0ABQ7MI46_BRACM|nr:hypothetical protein IGI04_019904 [Brassica rapa subsp. trilocularis]
MTFIGTLQKAGPLLGWSSSNTTNRGLRCMGSSPLLGLHDARLILKQKQLTAF